MDSTKETLDKPKCECCGFKKKINKKLNKNSYSIQKKVNNSNAFLMKQIEELENELIELLEQDCKCDK